MSGFIYLLDRRISLENRFFNTAGVTFTDNQCVNYVAASPIPRGPFVENRLSVQSLHTSPSIVGPDDVNFLGIVDLSDALVHPLFKTISSITGYPELATVYSDTSIRDAWASLLEGVGDLFSSIDEVDVRDVCLKEPGLVTTTVDGMGRHIGLHLDSFDMKSVYERDQCRNRICINLGVEERTFLFVNVPVIEMIRRLHASGHPIVPATVGSGIGRMFLHAFPDEPVNAIKIRPREAYIMPTENLLHDASTLGRSSLDISLTVLGRFVINTQQALTGWH